MVAVQTNAGVPFGRGAFAAATHVNPAPEGMMPGIFHFMQSAGDGHGPHGFQNHGHGLGSDTGKPMGIARGRRRMLVQPQQPKHGVVGQHLPFTRGRFQNNSPQSDMACVQNFVHPGGATGQVVIDGGPTQGIISHTVPQKTYFAPRIQHKTADKANRSSFMTLHPPDAFSGIIDYGLADGRRHCGCSGVVTELWSARPRGHFQREKCPNPRGSAQEAPHAAHRTLPRCVPVPSGSPLRATPPEKRGRRPARPYR